MQQHESDEKPAEQRESSMQLSSFIGDAPMIVLMKAMRYPFSSHVHPPVPTGSAP